MHTALGEPGLIGNLSDALLGVVTKSVENPKTFGPQSHVGLSSEGRLNSWSNSAPQRTGQTPNCPALGNFPRILLPKRNLFTILQCKGRSCHVCTSSPPRNTLFLKRLRYSPRWSDNDFLTSRPASSIS